MQTTGAESATNRLVVLYDGYCPVCRRSADIIRLLDFLNAIDLKRYQEFPLENLPVTLEKLGKRVHACDSKMDNCRECIFACASIMIRIPPLFIPALCCYILGAIGIGQKFYDFVSTNRYSLPFSGISKIFSKKLESG